MVVSPNRGDPNRDPKHNSPYYGDATKVPLILGNTHMEYVWEHFWGPPTFEALSPKP